MVIGAVRPMVIELAGRKSDPTELAVKLAVQDADWVTCPIGRLPLAGQPLRLGTAAITVYWQHGVLEARVWPLVT
jgi:hypothetical protein